MIPSKLPKGTTLEQWESYEKELQTHEVNYNAWRPELIDFDTEEEYKRAFNAWSFEKSVNRPNEPGYFRANND